MPSAVYHDLAEFGLRFITPDDSAYPDLVRDIQSLPQPFGPRPDSDFSAAAVLLNQSGKAVVTLAYVWKYRMADGHTRTSHHSNLCSSLQMDVLSGRVGVTRDLCSFILPGSKRLITQEGIFGDNSDVLPPESTSHGGGYVGAGGGGRMRRAGDHEEIVGMELDVVIFEDGLCVGSDDLGLFETIAQELERQRNTAQEVLQALRSGASIGRVFEIVRPLARQIGPKTDATGRARHSVQLLWMFANTAIHQLVRASDPELLAWFESAAQPSRIQLRRPS